MQIGKYYRHKIYHTFIKIESVDEKYPTGIHFYKNDVGCVGMGDSKVFNTDDYVEITKEEFQQEQKKIEQTILLRLL